MLTFAAAAESAKASRFRWRLPVGDGFETARLIRQQPRFHNTPIIFVTGNTFSEINQLNGYEVGAVDYISVPLVPEILRSKVALLINR